MYIPANPAVRDFTQVARDLTVPTPPPVPSPLRASSFNSLPTNTPTLAISPSDGSLQSLVTSTLSATSTVGSNNTGSDTTGVTTSKAKSGLSPAIIGAIVAVVVVFIAAIAFFFVRRWYIKRRQARSDKNRSWVGYNPDLDSVAEKAISPDNAVVDKADSTSVSESTGSHWSYHGPNARTEGTVPSTTTASPQPPLTLAPAHGGLRPLTLVAKAANYSNPDRPGTRSASPAPSVAVVPPPSENAARATSNVLDQNASYTLAVMQRPFIRSLPDELSANIGDQVGIVREYDDGWTLCLALNEYGVPIQQGMVPSECLEKLPAKTVVRNPSASGQTKK